MDNFDIIIVGGSFSGLTAALYLSESIPNLSIALIEKLDIINENKARDGRAFAISQSSLNIFEKIGILSSLKPFAGVIEAINIVDGNIPFYLNFNAGSAANSSDKFGLVIENFHIHQALRNQALKAHSLGKIEIICPNSYQEINFNDNQVGVTLENNRIIKGKLLLACDGKFSALRAKFNITTLRKSYHQSAVVFNISHQTSHQNIALEKFLPAGPFAVLPMQNPQQSSIIWTVRSKESQALLELSEDDFLNQLKKAMGDYLGEIKLLSPIFKYNLDLTVADKFYYQRMALIGDAAHSIHPIAGQGFNLGIEDIKIITALIKQNYQCGLDIGFETLLKQYNRQQKFYACKMVLATDALNGLFSNRSAILKLARNAGIFLVEKSPLLKNFFIKSAGGSLPADF